ncbi:hypothetical protein Baya_4588 [Bagarius yarrelli]|uniref:Uncharacterized protein n=1 Tax=Bagarius yarrelli TaxID=175774 RepID=A0A556TR68_BAGYA|nr:hypothetical protein Baya_4588 [Bagarius yarrelli]
MAEQVFLVRYIPLGDQRHERILRLSCATVTKGATSIPTIFQPKPHTASTLTTEKVKVGRQDLGRVLGPAGLQTMTHTHGAHYQDLTDPFHGLWSMRIL